MGGDPGKCLLDGGRQVGQQGGNGGFIVQPVTRGQRELGPRGLLDLIRNMHLGAVPPGG